MCSEEQQTQEKFKPNDVVLTMESEKDIDEIPVGTAIELTRKCSDGLWWGNGKIQGVVRCLLVYEQNLEHAFK